MLAHEIRNPLAPILNAVHLIEQEAEASPTLRQAGRIIERQLGRLVRIVDDLLDISRITRGKIQLRKERVTLQSVVGHSADAVRSLAESRQQRLTQSLPPEAVWLEADAVRLEQVFVNLLNNAAKYTEPGGPSRSPRSGWGTTAKCGCGTRASASWPRCCPASSTCSCRRTSRWTACRAGSASASPW
jgi:signal transduction histidine kinase